jgi:flagellar motility protein MotE (MotC chaperone)
MFVVTLIASELVAWMRRQPGTTSLRALLYMDEVFGYFPPSAMPPSKLPLLTLMKQARAFGIGVVLATQNPVDLDYKGLGNAGTWLIGRLQTERDKARVIEGLAGSAAAGSLDRAGLESLMSNLTQRTFLMRNVNDDAPVLFRTRWALSYLRGPLTLKEIERVTRADEAARPGGPAAGATTTSGSIAGGAAATCATAASGGTVPGRGGAKPIIQHDVTERYLATPAGSGAPHYEARLGARVRTHFIDRKAGLDTWRSHYVLAPVGSDGPDWARAETIADPGPQFASDAAADATYAEPPATLLSMRERKRWAASLEDHVLRSLALALWSCPDLKLTAAPGTTEGEFRASVALALREKRDEAVDALRRRYRARLDALENRVRTADQKIERERSQASSQVTDSALAIGGSLLGALFGSGRRSSLFSKASTAARNVGRASKERADVAQAESDARAVREQLDTLNAELEAEVTRLEAGMDPATVPVETMAVTPRKSDITVEEVALVWCP